MSDISNKIGRTKSSDENDSLDVAFKIGHTLTFEVSSRLWQSQIPDPN